MALSEDEVERLSTILATLGECKAKMNDKSREFVSDVEQRYDKYGSDLRMSPKQWAWLENLMEQFG